MVDDVRRRTVAVKVRWLVMRSTLLAFVLIIGSCGGVYAQTPPPGPRTSPTPGPTNPAPTLPGVPPHPTGSGSRGLTGNDQEGLPPVREPDNGRDGLRAGKPELEQ
jgi:hypothetical protein